jgi:hypothetical protein
VFQSLESQLARLEEEKLKLLMESSEFKTTVQVSCRFFFMS